MNKMNKHGDIPITILVIGVLALCGLALFSFYFSDRNIKAGLDSVDAIESILIRKEKISLYNESLGFTQEDIKELFQIKTDVHTQQRYVILERGPLSVRYNLP